MPESTSPRLTKRRKLLVGTAIVALFLTTVVLGLRGREASSEASRRVSALTSTGSGNSTTQPDHEYTNQLIHETSPYLLQHAHNPVNWYSWGKDALQKAKEQDKPIFLSVGYSTCYWCHVMERESFEREDVAKILNEHFIAIKVDREERPEIDEQYMLATQLVTGGAGGWPNSVWLTPDGRPWMAGTYFPREQFKQVLTQLAEIWKTRRPDVEQQADQLAQAIQRIGSGQNVQSAKPVNQQLVDQAIGALRQSFDARRGGFGGAPKFPPHGSLRLLIHEYRRTKDPAIRNMLTRTLDAMAMGGMHDHVGGGFHRYSTDERWFLPHFEKMLYDNAQLIRAYTDGYLLTGDERYQNVVQDIFSWVRREMTGPDGAFYSAIDSGEVGEEGEFYLWEYDEVLDVLKERDGKLFAELYGLKKGGNFHEEATGKRPGTNVLSLPTSIDRVAKDKRLDAAMLRSDLEVMRATLLTVRNKRVPPHKDDKILTSWNALMIAALAYAGRQLNEPRYTQAAAKAAEFILATMTRDGQLLRTYRAGQAKLSGYLDDYAYFAEALVELHEATGEQRWLDWARRLADTMLDEFEDERDGGFFFTTASHEDMLLRSKSLRGGGNVPSSNGVAAQVLLRLGRITGKPQYTQAADRTLKSLSGMMWQSPRGADSLILATAISLEPSGSDKVVSATASPATQSAPAAASPPDVREVEAPVTVEGFISHLTVAPGQRFHVAVALDIEEGWHLYADNPGIEFLVPSTVSLRYNDLVTAGEIVAPEPHRMKDPILKQMLNTYTGRIWYLVPLTVSKDAAAGAITLELDVRTQPCDDSRCLLPRTNTLRLPVLIDPDAGAGDLRHETIFESLEVHP